MYQPTFADLEYEGKKLKTRREKFLSNYLIEVAEVGGPMSCRRCFGYTACSCSTI